MVDRAQTGRLDLAELRICVFSSHWNQTGPDQLAWPTKPNWIRRSKYKNFKLLLKPFVEALFFQKSHQSYLHGSSINFCLKSLRFDYVLYYKLTFIYIYIIFNFKYNIIKFFLLFKLKNDLKSIKIDLPYLYQSGLSQHHRPPSLINLNTYKTMCLRAFKKYWF